MNEKLQALLRVFRQGEAVADPVTWRNRTDAVNAVLAFLVSVVAVARGFGVELPVDDADLASIALSVVSFVGAANVVTSIVTDKARGLKGQP